MSPVIGRSATGGRLAGVGGRTGAGNCAGTWAGSAESRQRIPGEAVILGLRIGETHVNSRGLAHGGLIAALADNAMGLSCGEQAEAGSLGGLLTASMTTDYVGVARQGQWLEFTTSFVKLGRSICFAQCFVTADGKPCARANATFSVVRAA